MNFAGKRKQWKNKVTGTRNMEMHARILPSRVKVAGPMAAGSSKKQKVKPDLSHKTVQFEGLNGNKCRKWWQDTPDTDVIKKILVSYSASHFFYSVV